MLCAGVGGPPPEHDCRPKQPLEQTIVSLHSPVQYRPRTVTESPTWYGPPPAIEICGATHEECAAGANAPSVTASVSEDRAIATASFFFTIVGPLSWRLAVWSNRSLHGPKLV